MPTSLQRETLMMCLEFSLIFTIIFSLLLDHTQHIAALFVACSRSAKNALHHCEMKLKCDDEQRFLSLSTLTLSRPFFKFAFVSPIFAAFSLLMALLKLENLHTKRFFKLLSPPFNLVLLCVCCAMSNQHFFHRRTVTHSAEKWFRKKKV